jgi:hypothetical protein
LHVEELSIVGLRYLGFKVVDLCLEPLDEAR